METLRKVTKVSDGMEGKEWADWLGMFPDGLFDNDGCVLGDWKITVEATPLEG